MTTITQHDDFWCAFNSDGHLLCSFIEEAAARHYAEQRDKASGDLKALKQAVKDAVRPESAVQTNN